MPNRHWVAQYLFITCHMTQVRPKATRPMPATEQARTKGLVWPTTATTPSVNEQIKLTH